MSAPSLPGQVAVTTCIVGEHTSAQIGFHLAGPGTIERDEHDAWFRQRHSGSAKARSQLESEQFSPGHKAHYGGLLMVRKCHEVPTIPVGHWTRAVPVCVTHDDNARAHYCRMCREHIQA